MAARTEPAVDKRRLILDAAVRVFARQGFHTCRVSDIADEAGVAYGLVYHYFKSKDEILDTLFLERWDILLRAIREVDAQDIPPREKLYAIASLHRRLLPPRPRPDEGDHRRGHARGEHVRAHAPRARSARPTTGSPRSSQRAQGDGDVPHRRHAGFRRAGLLRRDRAGADRLDLRRCCRPANGNTSRPRP